jgi:hypothetical protein
MGGGKRRMTAEINLDTASREPAKIKPIAVRSTLHECRVGTGHLARYATHPNVVA